MGAVFHLCRCGEPIHRISAASFLHDDGIQQCADGELARPTVDDHVAFDGDRLVVA